MCYFFVLTMDNDNIFLQEQEVHILQSIYEDCWKAIDKENKSFSIDVVDGDKAITFYVKFTPDYPTHGPPEYQLSAPLLSKEDKQNLSSELEEHYLKNIGEPIVLLWIGIINDYFKNKCSTNNGNIVCNKDDAITSVSDNIPNTNIEYSIIHGDTIRDRKSVFQGHVAVISNALQVNKYAKKFNLLNREVLSQLRVNKKIANATHNIFAYRIRENENCVLQDCDDDGETHAGGRLLHLLQIMDIYNVLVVVSRWYGGIHLGPVRFKHITNAARQTLQIGDFDLKQKKYK